MKFISILAFTTTLISGINSHVTANPSKGPAGSYFVTSLRIPHGCGDSSTVKVQVNLTSDLTAGATAQQIPGWKITYGYPDADNSTSAATPVPSESASGGAKKIPNSVTWEASPGNELPHDLFLDFGLSIKLPLTAQYNNTIYFPTLQFCKNGTADWSSWPGGVNGTSAKTPAPQVVLVNDTSADGASGAKKTSGSSIINMNLSVVLVVLGAAFAWI